MHEERQARVRENLRAMGLTQMLVVDPAAVTYLTGYENDPMERFQALFLPVEGEPTLTLNRLFPDPRGWEHPVTVLADTDDVVAPVAKLCDVGAPLGVDKALPAKWLLPLMDAQAASGYVLASSAVDDARALKSPAEQDAMRRASALNDQGMAWLREQVRPGVTEREVAAALEGRYQELGAEGNSFAPIVSFGANAADPHHEPDDTVLEPGMCALFDVGCRADGYCADMTRTFHLGEPDEEFRRVYELVRESNEAAEALVAPGVELAKLDRAARDVIERGGYGERFTHRLGHFIGAEVHEPGDVSSNNHAVCEPGMCFSIEPGVYLPGRFGVRIEDLVLVTDDGCAVLNRYPKELQVVQPLVP